MNQEQTEAEARTAAFKKSWEYKACAVAAVLSFFGLVFGIVNDEFAPNRKRWLNAALLSLCLKWLGIQNMIKKNLLDDTGLWGTIALIVFSVYLFSVMIFTGDMRYAPVDMYILVLIFLPVIFDVLLFRQSPWCRKWKETNQNAPQTLA